MINRSTKEMKRAALTRVVPVALVLAGLGVGVAAAPGVQAAGAVVAKTAMAPVTLKGTLIKVDSSTSFTINAAKKFILVKADAMTRLKLGTKAVKKMSSLTPGDSLVVTGHQESGFVSATTVVAETGMGLVSFTGTLSKIDSASSITVTVGKVHEFVKLSATTHMSVKPSSLRVGDRLTVTGHQESGFATAETVIAHM